jgi:hypothetical protein
MGLLSPGGDFPKQVKIYHRLSKAIRCIARAR